MRSSVTPSRTLVSRALIVGAVATVPFFGLSAWAADIVKANNTAPYVQGASWVGGITPLANDIAVWNASSNASTIAIGGALFPGGVRITDATGPIGMTNNTLTVGRFGIDMSLATQDFTLASVQPQTATAQTWRVANGRTLTISSNFLANTPGSTQNPAATVNFSPSATGSIVLAAPGLNSNTNALNVNALIGNGTNGFAVYRGTDFAAIDSDRKVVGGSSVLTYQTNSSATVTASFSSSPVNISTAYNTTTQAGSAFLVNASSVAIPQGMRFNTPNPNAQPWVVDFGGGAAVPARVLSLGVNGILVGADVNTDVVFTNAAFGSGTRGSLTLTASAFNYIRNYSPTANLILGVGTTGSAARLIQAGPGTVIIQQTLSNSAPYFATEGTTFLTSTGRIGNSLQVAGGTVWFNTALPSTSVSVYNGGTLGGSGSTGSVVTVGSFAFTGNTIPLPGTLSPGNQGIGTLTMTGLTLSGVNSFVNFEVASPTSRDLISVTTTGTLTINTGAKFNILAAGTTNAYTTSGTFPLVRAGATLTLAGTAAADLLVNGNAYIGNPQLGTVYTFANTAGSLNLTINTVTSNNWGFDTSGSWNTPGNWSSATVPSGVSAFATIGDPGAVITEPRGISLDAAQTVGTLRLNSTQPLAITAGTGGSLVFENGAAQGELFVQSGSHTIDAPVSYSGTAGLNIRTVGSADSITFGQSLSGGALLISGPGTVALTGAATPTATSVNSSTLKVGDGATSGSISGGIALTAGTLQLSRSGTYSFSNNVSGASGTVVVDSGGTVTLSGANTFGTTTSSSLTASNATVILGSGSAIPTGAFVKIATGSVVDVNSNNPNLGGLSGGGTLTDASGAGLTTLGFVSAGDSTFAGSIQQTTRVLGIAKAGVGTQTFTGNVSLSGDVTVTAGMINAQTPLRPVTGSLVVTGPGAISLAPAPTSVSATGYTVAGEFAGITVNASSTASGLVSIPAINRAANKASVLVTNALTVSGGTLDLGTSDLIIKGGAASASAIQALVAGGTLTASGSLVTSPQHVPFTTLAVFPNDTDGGVTPYFSSYDGVTGLLATDLIVKFTYVGDTNLDGLLDGKDFARLLEGYSTGQTGWAWGDVDNSGGPVSITDITAFQAALTYYQSNPQTNLGGGQGGGGSSGAVPEPSAFALLALALTPLTTRRRR